MSKWQSFWRAFFNTHKWMEPRLIPRTANKPIMIRVGWDDPPMEIKVTVVLRDSILLTKHATLWSADYGIISFKDVVAWREV